MIAARLALVAALVAAGASAQAQQSTDASDVAAPLLQEPHVIMLPREQTEPIQ